MQTTDMKSDPGLVTVTPNGENVPGGGIVNHQVADRFFAIKNDNLMRAFDDIKNNCIQEQTDGEVLGNWLLTEISYWNRDKERIVILCGNTILVCKYDFIVMRLMAVERIQLSKITQVQKGKLEYPANSIIVPRLYDGVRVTWGNMEVPWYQKWNPLNTDIPFTTFTSHPVLQLSDLQSKELYDVHEFFSMMKQLLASDSRVDVIESQPIMIESYAGFASYVHNASRLGFSRERGGVNF